MPQREPKSITRLLYHFQLKLFQTQTQRITGGFKKGKFSEAPDKNKPSDSIGGVPGTVNNAEISEGSGGWDRRAEDEVGLEDDEADDNPGDLVELSRPPEKATGAPRKTLLNELLHPCYRLLR
ncbi:hypothetical protein MPER_13007 [Moniliophthora perniciosa FA553]|nr:hypothetical protein MPER_13007 [Moniliophthora perniciosa FA553]